MNTLIKKLLQKAVSYYGAHDHDWAEEMIATMVVTQTVGSTKVVHSKKVMASYCEQCSAIRFNDEVFCKVGDPNLYSTP